MGLCSQDPATEQRRDSLGPQEELRAPLLGLLETTLVTAQLSTWPHRGKNVGKHEKDAAWHTWTSLESPGLTLPGLCLTILLLPRVKLDPQVTRDEKALSASPETR